MSPRWVWGGPAASPAPRRGCLCSAARHFGGAAARPGSPSSGSAAVVPGTSSRRARPLWGRTHTLPDRPPRKRPRGGWQGHGGGHFAEVTGVPDPAGGGELWGSGGLQVCRERASRCGFLRAAAAALQPALCPPPCPPPEPCQVTPSPPGCHRHPQSCWVPPSPLGATVTPSPPASCLGTSRGASGGAVLGGHPWGRGDGHLLVPRGWRRAGRDGRGGGIALGCAPCLCWHGAARTLWRRWGSRCAPRAGPRELLTFFLGLGSPRVSLVLLQLLLWVFWGTETLSVPRGRCGCPLLASSREPQGGGGARAGAGDSRNGVLPKCPEVSLARRQCLSLPVTV